MNPGNVEFGRRVAVKPSAELGASRVSRFAVLLELSGKLDPANRFRHRAREAGVAQRYRLALGLVAREQSRAAPSEARSGELPAEVGRVVDRGVVALAAGRGEEMGRVARDEDAPAAEALGDEGEAGGPLRDPQNLEGELAAGRANERFARVVGRGRAFARELHVE